MAFIENLSLDGRVVGRTIGVVVIALLLKFFHRLYQVRSLYREVATKHGIVSTYGLTCKHTVDI